MQGAAVPRSHQSPSRLGAVGRQGVILLTYLLAAVELTCLFMQFSILPVSSPAPGQRPPSLCHCPSPDGGVMGQGALLLESTAPLS